MRLFFSVVVLTILTVNLCAQEPFTKKSLGVWKGQMHMFAKGFLYDSIEVKLFVKETADSSTVTWRKEYYDKDTTRVKDYKLRHEPYSKPNPKRNIYTLDEGDGIELPIYRFGNKLYSVFDTEGIMLTSSYQFQNDSTLIFEVSSGEKIEGSSSEVNSYTIDYLQRIVFHKED